MNPKLKNFLILAAKNAVNAALVAIAPVLQNPAKYNLHTLSGIGQVAVILGGAIVAREALVWGPRLLAWSQSDENEPPAPPPQVKAVAANRYTV